MGEAVKDYFRRRANLSRMGLRYSHIEGRRGAPPPSVRSRSERRGGPTRAKPERGGGALPRGASSTIRRGCRWLPWPNRRIILVPRAPRPATPHPYPSPPLGFAERGEGGARSRHV